MFSCLVSFFSVTSTWLQGILMRVSVFAMLKYMRRQYIYIYSHAACYNKSIAKCDLCNYFATYIHVCMYLIFWRDMTWCHHNSPSQAESIEETVADRQLGQHPTWSSQDSARKYMDENLKHPKTLENKFSLDLKKVPNWLLNKERTLKEHDVQTQESIPFNPSTLPLFFHIGFFLGQVAKGSNHISVQLDSLSHVDFARATLLRDLTRYGLLHGFVTMRAQKNSFLLYSLIWVHE